MLFTTREQFRKSYPKLTDEDIRTELETSEMDEYTVPILQAFYRTTSYSAVRQELDVGQAVVRTTVLLALRKLPETAPLHAALRMGYDNLNILR